MNIVCCICRNENLYIEEWCEHHFNLGFDKIVLCDNHKKENEEHLEDVPYIRQKIAEHKIDLVVDSSDCYQNPFYNKVLEEWEFDWCLVVDADEFLIFNGFNTIQEFISQECYNDTDVVVLNWLMYGCDGKVYYEDKPVKERFVKPLHGIKNRVCKSLIKKGENNRFVANTHVIQHNGKVFRDADGELITDFSIYSGAVTPKAPTYKNAWVNHYFTKSLEEYVQKVKRAKADSNTERRVEDFFNIEPRKPEYVRYLKDNGYDFLSFKEITGFDKMHLAVLLQDPNIIKLTPARVVNLKKILDYCEFDLGGDNIRPGVVTKWLKTQTIGYGDGNNHFLKVLSHPNDFDERYLEKVPGVKPMSYRLIKGNPYNLDIVKNDIRTREERQAEYKANTEWWAYNVHMGYFDTTGQAKIDVIKFFNTALRDFKDFQHTDDIDYIISYLADKQLLRCPGDTNIAMTYDAIKEQIDIIYNESKKRVGFTNAFYCKDDVELYQYQLTNNLIGWAVVRGTCGCYKDDLFKILPWNDYNDYLPKDETIENKLNNNSGWKFEMYNCSI